MCRSAAIYRGLPRSWLKTWQMREIKKFFVLDTSKTIELHIDILNWNSDKIVCIGDFQCQITDSWMEIQDQRSL